MTECPNCKRYREALERLRDCDWVITLPDRMDAVRAIARKALREAETGADATPTPHPDTLRLEKLAKDLNHYYGAASGAECLLEWWQHVPGDVSPDDLRTYIDGLED